MLEMMLKILAYPWARVRIDFLCLPGQDKDRRR
jgi:hypothetical protein